MPVVDGGVEEVDAAADGCDYGIAIGNVGGGIWVTQVGSEAQARYLQVVELPIKAKSTRAGSPGSEAGGSFRRGKAMIHPTIVAERAARAGETYAGSHSKPLRAGIPFACADADGLESEACLQAKPLSNSPA